MKTAKISENIAKEMYQSGIPELKTIALETYPELFKKEKNWDDFGTVCGFYVYVSGSCYVYSYKSHNSHPGNQNTFPSEKLAEAYGILLPQILQWRTKSVGIWKPSIGEICFKIGYNYINKELFHECVEHQGGSGITFPFCHFEDDKGEYAPIQFIQDHKTLLTEFFTLINE